MDLVEKKMLINSNFPRDMKRERTERGLLLRELYMK